jgi:hypothetical protein
LAALLVGLSLASAIRRRKPEKKAEPFSPAEEAVRLVGWALGKLWLYFRSTAAAGRDSRPAGAEGGEHGGT